MPEKTPYFDNVDRTARIRRRAGAYGKIISQMLLRGVPPLDIVRTQFPRWLPDAGRPPTLSLEFTNHCDLACLYCNNSLKDRPQGWMSEATFAAVLAGIRAEGIARLKIGGLGEPTLHPGFDSFMRRLSPLAAHIAVTSNGQWRSQGSIDTLVEHADLVEISIDAGGAENYEYSRPGASHERLLRNLHLLREEQKRGRRRFLINIRLMIRPSQAGRERELARPWRRFADMIMPQHILKRERSDYDEDIFLPMPKRDNSIPRCRLIFKDLGVNWNGNVPLCQMSVSQIGSPGYLLGNIEKIPLGGLWSSPMLRKYRAAHRHGRPFEGMICAGCPGA